MHNLNFSLNNMLQGIGVFQHDSVVLEKVNVMLLIWNDYPEDYDPSKDRNRPTWEALHHLIRKLYNSGENAAGELLAKMSESSEDIRQLAYFLYTMCERKGNAEDARYYNELMTSWHAIIAASMEHMKSKPEQMRLF